MSTRVSKQQQNADAIALLSGKLDTLMTRLLGDAPAPAPEPTPAPEVKSKARVMAEAMQALVDAGYDPAQLGFTAQVPDDKPVFESAESVYTREVVSFRSRWHKYFGRENSMREETIRKGNSTHSWVYMFGEGERNKAMDMLSEIAENLYGFATINSTHPTSNGEKIYTVTWYQYSAQNHIKKANKARKNHADVIAAIRGE